MADQYEEAAHHKKTYYGAVLLIYVLLTVAYTVFFYLALYRLYKSCDEQNAVTYLVLSIFIRITMPIFVFLCGKKDSLIMQDYLYMRSGRI